MYAMVATRRDIVHEVGVVSRFMHNLGRPHWNAMKHIFRYLFGNKTTTSLWTEQTLRPSRLYWLGLRGLSRQLKIDIPILLQVQVRRHFLKSKLQDCTVMSTTKAEYVARTFRQVNSKWTPIVFSDSQGVVALAKNLVHHNVSKHIEVRYHFVRDSATKDMLSLEKVSTTDNVADAITKSLSTYQFRSLRDRMGMELILDELRK
jgi:hypothetical protein